MKVHAPSNSSPASFGNAPPSTLVGSTQSIVVSDDELSVPSEQETVVNKVYQEWKSDCLVAKDDLNDSIHDQDFMEVDEFFESDLLPMEHDDTSASSLDFGITNESPLSMTVEEEERLIHPFSPMPVMKMTSQSWDDEAPFSPPLDKEQKYLDACASPTSLHGEMETSMEYEKRIVSPLPSPPLADDDDSDLTLEEKIQRASLKLAESMKRSQMTRASLTFKPHDYKEKNDVDSLLSKIEESTNQIHEQLNLQRSEEDGFSEESVRKLLSKIEESTSQLQRQFSNEQQQEEQKETTKQ